MRIATLPEPTQTANAAIFTAPTLATGKKTKSSLMLEMLCAEATLFTNHKFFSKYFKSQITITRPDGLCSHVNTH